MVPLISAWLKRRAAKRYALRLGPCLLRHFGSSATYSRGQIERGIAETGLNPRYAALGYACFLEEADYQALAGELPLPLAYEEARDLVARYVPGGGTYTPQSEVNAYAKQNIHGHFD